MKRFFCVIFLISLGFTSSAQRLLLKNLTTFDDKLLHFGFSLGINTFDFNVAHYPTIGDNPNFVLGESIGGVEVDKNMIVRGDIATLIPGFTVGIVTNLRLAESFDLRFLPGMSFGERKLTYNIRVLDVNDPGQNISYSIKSTFLDFPLLLKYKSKKMNNQRPYLIAGGALRVDISKSGQEDLVRLKPLSTYIEAGVGWDSYLQFFRLSTELKFSFGMNNVLAEGPGFPQSQLYTNTFSRLASNIFTLSFHFE